MEIHKKSKYLFTIPIYLIAIIFIFQGIFKEHSIIPIESLVGLGLGFIMTAFLYVDRRLSKIVLNPSIGIETDSLSNCFQRIEKRKTHFDSLRIYGNNSLHFFPLFANSKITVNNLELLLRKKDSGNLEQDSEFNKIVDNYIEEWTKLKKKGRIRKLSIKRYLNSPTEWQAIFDNSFLIFGLNYPNQDDWKDAELMLDDATLIENHSVQTGKVIKNYSNRFKLFFKNAKN